MLAFWRAPVRIRVALVAITATVAPIAACGGASGDAPADASPVSDAPADASPASDAGADASPTNGKDGGGDSTTVADDSGDASTPFVPAPHLPWPTIPSHGGHVLDPLRIVSVVTSDEPYAADIQSIGDAIASSAWFGAFAPEYGLTGTPTHVLVKGTPIPSGSAFKNADVAHYIATTIAAQSPPIVADGHTVFVLYMPPGATLAFEDGTPDTTCSRPPHHFSYGTGGDGAAVISRCQLSYPSQLEMFAVDGAHEIAEAASDPRPAVATAAWEMWSASTAKPWSSSVWNEVEMESSAEIGDLCIFTRVVEKGRPLQRVFSNAAAAKGGDPCVPALPVPYFNVSPDPSTRGWFQVSAGQTIDVPLVGWSTAPTGDWIVWADKLTGVAGSKFATSLSSATTQIAGKHTYATTDNGHPLSLHVTIPTGALPGWWGAVNLWSWHADASGAYVAGEDFGHEAVVGFYISP